MPRPVHLTVWIVATFVAVPACETSSPPLGLDPAVIDRDEWATAELAVVGLPRSAYLVTAPSGLVLRPELAFEIGGVSAHVVRVDGTPIVTLDEELAIGLHDLVVVAGARTYAATDALEVRDRRVEAGGADAGPIDVGPPDPRCTRSDVVACWPLDGDGLDRGPRGNHLTLTDVGFPDGRAAVFGPSSGATLPPTADLSAGTVSIMTWVRIDEAPGGLSYAMLLEREGVFFLAVAGGGRVWCGIDARFLDYVRSPDELTVGTWHHVACVRDDATTSLFVDGVKVDASELGPFVDGDGALGVGESAPGGEHQLIGALDELRIYDAVLSVGEVQSDYVRGRP